MLKNVVLPAPFGPIRLTTACSSIVKSTLSTATRPPNSFRSASTTSRSSAISGGHVLERRVVDAGLELDLSTPLGEEAVGPQQHHQHDDQARDPEADERRVHAAAADHRGRGLLARVA